MSNKITLATIQFRADTKGVNPALDAMRQSAKDAHKEVDELEKAFTNGIKTMKDANGVEFNVADRLRAARKEAKSFDQGVRELIKGATALESVVKNIQEGIIEASSRAELKGAINGAQSRLRPIREKLENGTINEEDLQRQRELNTVILESQKQLNRLDHDTAKVIETIQQGGTISQSVLDQEQKGLRDMLTLIPKGTEEWNKYNAQLQTIEAHVASIRKQEQQAATSLLSSNDLGQYSEAEIRQAIEAGKELIQTYKTADPAAQQLAKNIVAAEEHLKQYGVETERAAQREAEALRKAAQQRAEADQLMMQQLQQGVALTQTALKSQEQYWQRLIDDPKTAAANLQTYKDNLATVHQLQEQLTRTQNVEWADKLIGNRYVTLSEADLRKAIAAAREYQQTFAPTESMYRTLSQQIVKAEEHLRKFGLEAERTAQKEINAEQKAAQERTKQNQLMQTQLQQGTALSQSALKAQESYWQRLIDDPKTAAQSIQQYKNNLQQVKDLQEQMAAVGVRTKGQDALNFFRGDTSNASASQIQEQQKALIAYRDSLPRQTEASVIAEINNYIEKTGAAAKVAAGEVMAFADAEALAGQLGTQGFSASTDKLKLAKKALEDAQNAAGRGTARFTELQDAINKIDLELSKTGELTKEVQAVLDQPKGKSFNALKQAVEQGRLALNAMDRSTEEGQKRFEELAAKIKAADFEMKQLGNSSKGTASAFDKAWSRLKTYVGLYVGAAVAMQKLSQAMGDLLTLSDKMGEVRKTTGFTADEVGRLSNNLAKLDTRTSLTQLMELSSLAGSVGLKTQEQVQGFTEAADQLIVALPELGNESARTIIKIANATGDLEKNGGNVRETLEKVGSTIIALRANSASAAGPITDFVSRVGAVGAQAGISIDQIAALGSTIDALGGRVEMSATALSRMIPAIKNNSFAIANSINVTESYLKSLAPMEQMVLIFQKMRDNIQHIDTSTEQGQEQMAQTIEGMLGRNATMREVMKDLEQQGARAGIVFGLLSQNVDELEKQLGIASEAYEKNTALANEFANMNETAAAKWERLKNQFEEAFVGDSAQRRLGWIIDRLREVVDLLTGNSGISVALRSIIAYLTLVRVEVLSIAKGALVSLGNGLKNIGVLLGFVKGEMTALQWGNIFTAAAGAILLAADAMGAFKKKVSEAAKTLNAAEDAEKNAKKESIEQRIELEKLYKATQDQTKSLDERKKALKDMVGDEKYKQYYENLASESDFAKAAASAYDELAASIMETARARAYEEKAKELQQKRMELELEKEEAEERRKEAQGRVSKESLRTSLVGAQANQQLGTSGMRAMATGMSRESQNLQKAKADVKKEDSAIKSLEADIALVDKGIERLQGRVKELKINTPTGTDENPEPTPTPTTNPYGSYNRVTSPYQDWDADALVSRRKEMLERVRALANGAEVQAVLSEDAKFITEATRKNIKDTKQAIEWYNTERLKIQDALHEKHLTNTGDWMDPTKQKARAKVIKDEWSAYLNELDAYYTERKTRIQEAATEEGITEAEMKNRTLANEMEWHQRRAELQKLYAKKSTEVTEEEQQAIFDILSERTGDTADFIQKTIGKTVKFIYDIGQKSEAEQRTIFGKLDKGIERDLLKQQQAVTAQMKAIRDIIEKERPYDGITSNLRENLVTMGILTADMTAERNRLMRENADMSDFNSRQATEEMKRTAFMLGEAENAYSTTIEEVMRHMGEQGMQAWADAIRGDTQMQQALMAQLRTAYDEIQNAIKKEASLIKKQTDIWWADIAEGQTQSRRDGFEKALSRLGLAEDQVKRANSLIGAGQASERVADKLAIKQMQVRLAMQTTYYNRMRQIGEERIAQLKAEGRLEDAEHLRRSLNLAKTEELKKLEEQRVAIANQMEESQNRLYTALREWGDLVASSLQGVFEASNTGQADFYTEQAKKRLTGASTSGQYIVVENAGTKDAEASYQTLSDQEVLDIEQRNAMADAWKKLMDDLNMKMSETITDQLNAMLQNVSIDANTDALDTNTKAILRLAATMAGGGAGDDSAAGAGFGVDGISPLQPTSDTPAAETIISPWQAYAEGSTAAKETILQNQQDIAQGQVQTDTKIQKSTQSAFAKMTVAANLYGIAYQAMSNENMSASQKFGMIAVQAAGNAAITALTTNLSQTTGQVAAETPSVLSKLWSQLGWGAIPVFAIFTGLLGGLMGLAASKIAKSKSEIAQATGVSSVASGRLTTGMLTYAEGNVNEFTDPSTLREGRQYNVDAADGKTYRARYMGRSPKTHLTNGPEFHLSGERGREMIIDAGTTRQITMNEGEIWHAIQTLSGGGRISALRRRGRGVAAFADGNLSEFSDYSEYSESAAAGMSAEQAASLQASIDRQSDLLEDLRINGIKATFDVYGKGGLVDSYDSGKKTLNRYGQRY